MEKNRKSQHTTAALKSYHNGAFELIFLLKYIESMETEKWKSIKTKLVFKVQKQKVACWIGFFARQATVSDPRLSKRAISFKRRRALGLGRS